MKKFFVSLVMLLSTSAASLFAQSSLVATLSHNDTISVFYGINALKSAYGKSVDGDVITLSGGNFNAPGTIEKNISICGAGMEEDSVNNIQATVLLDDFVIVVKNTESHHLKIENIWHGGIITCGDVEVYTNGVGTDYANGVEFVKCRLENMICDYDFNSKLGIHSRSGMKKCKFFHCKIKGISMLGDATFTNCYVGAPGKAHVNGGQMNYECVNCVVYGSLVDSHINYSTFTNCILIGSNVLAATNMVSNSIGIYTGDVDGTNIFSNLPQAMNSNVCFMESSDVFKTFRPNGTSNWTDKDNFELLDIIKEKYLGTDGKEIGMYGGNIPFSPKSLLTRIKEFDVASKSTIDGKLGVDVEIGVME